jgi:succinyl-CoA synthetase beta subunit
MPGRLPDRTAGIGDRERAYEIIAACTAAGRIVLTEPEAKELTRALGIPAARGALARTADDAATLARELGGPVVLKVVATGVTHKSSRGWVEYPVCPDLVRDAYQQLVDRVQYQIPSSALQGVLVEEYVAGGVECAVGYARLDRFGPVVMVGLGGVLVEAMGEVTFRLAPLHHQDAEEALSEIRAFRCTGGGRPDAVGKAALARALVVLGEIAADPRLDAVREVELNPIVVGRFGCVALDAVVTLRGAGR